MKRLCGDETAECLLSFAFIAGFIVVAIGAISILIDRKAMIDLYKNGADISCGFTVGYKKSFDGFSEHKNYRYENIVINNRNSLYFEESRIFKYGAMTTKDYNCEILK